MTPLSSHEIPTGSPITSLDVVTVDGRPLVVGVDYWNDAFTWDPHTTAWTRCPLATPWTPEDEHLGPEPTSIAATMVDGRIVLAGGGDHQGLAQWDLATGAVRTYARPWYSVSVITAAPGSRFVTGSSGPLVQVWDATLNEPDPELEDYEDPIDLEDGHEDGIGGVAAGDLHGRMTIAVAGDRSGRVRVWNLDGAELFAAFPDLDAGVRGVGLTTDEHGRSLVVAATDDALHLGRPDDGSWETDIDVPGPGRVMCLDVGLVNGNPVAVTGESDGAVRLWELDRGRPGAAPDGCHVGEVMAVRVLDLDGRPVAVTGGRDGILRMWGLDG